MIQQDINPYDEKKFKLEFESSSLYEKIYNDYDLISYSDNLNIFEFKESLGHDSESVKTTKIFLTPRGWLSFSIFDAVSLYYLKYLTDLNPPTIYDIGCGSNVFKKYIPNIQGIDITNSKNTLIKTHVDFYDDSLLDDSFYLNNFEKFDSAFSICSLHYYPLCDIRKRVIQFSSLISKGGRGYISFNVTRMLEHQLNVDRYPKLSKFQINKIDQLIRETLYELPFKIEVFETTIKKQFDNYLNGNIRIVFTKT